MKLRMNLPPLVPRGARRVSLSRLAQPRAGPDAGTDRGAAAAFGAAALMAASGACRTWPARPTMSVSGLASLSSG